MGKIFNHTKAGELGSFIIGDVVLSIPPSAITTTRIENNEEITALRSKYPMLRKTGQSIMTVTVMWQAVLEYNGMTPIYTEWEKLRRVFAIFKCAPFVQVQNEHLRKVLNMQDNYNRMAFGLKNLVISTSPDSTDILEARLDMIFLNYFPYSQDFSYTNSAGGKNVNANNSDVFSSYIDMWMSQNMDVNLTDHGIKDWKSNNTGTTNLIYNLYKAFPMPLVPFSTIPPDMQAHIPSGMQTIGPDGTAYGYNPIIVDPDHTANPKIKAWTSDHDAESSRYSFFYKTQNLKFTADNSGNSGDTFTTGIIINCANKLAQIPLSSYQFPTYQHLGPGTTTVGISLQDNDPDGFSIGNVQKILNTMNNQFFALRTSWRDVHTIHRMQAIYVENQILNMFGVRAILPDNLKTSTSQEGLFTTAELLGVQYENIFESLQSFTITDQSKAYLNTLYNLLDDPSTTASLAADKSLKPLSDYKAGLLNDDISYIEDKLSQIPADSQQQKSFAAALGQLPQLPYAGPPLDYASLKTFANNQWNGFNSPINNLIPGLMSRGGNSPMSWTDMLVLTAILKSGNYELPAKIDALQPGSLLSGIGQQLGIVNSAGISYDGGKSSLNYKPYETALDTYGKAQSPTYQNTMYRALLALLAGGGGLFNNAIAKVSKSPQFQEALDNSNAAQAAGPGSDPINISHGAYNDLGLTGMFSAGTSFSPAYYMYDYSQSNREEIKSQISTISNLAQQTAQKTSLNTISSAWTYHTQTLAIPTEVTGVNAIALCSRTSFDLNNPSNMFPTFKLFLIEDAAGTVMYAYDDFKSYASVQSIEVIKYRNKPDAALIKLSNLSGILSHKLYDNSVDGAREFKMDTAYSSSILDTPSGSGLATKSSGYRVNGQIYADGMPANLKFYPLQTGSKIQIRMGYDNNPDKLFPVFSGIVTEISEENELITLMAQSFMVELLDIPDGGTPVDGWGLLGWLGNTSYDAKTGVANLLGGSPKIALSDFWNGLTTIINPLTKSPAFGGGFMSVDGTSDAIMTSLIQSPTAKHFGRWQINTDSAGQDPFIRGFAWGPALAKTPFLSTPISNALATAYDRSYENILISQVVNFDGSVVTGPEARLQRAWDFEDASQAPAQYWIPPDEVRSPWAYMKDVSRRRPEYILATKTYGFPWNCDATLVYANPLDFYKAAPEISAIGGATPGPDDSKNFQLWWKAQGRPQFTTYIAPAINSLLDFSGSALPGSKGSSIFSQSGSPIPADVANKLGIVPLNDPATQAKKIDNSGNSEDLVSYTRDIENRILQINNTNPLAMKIRHYVDSGIAAWSPWGYTTFQTQIDNLHDLLAKLINSMKAFTNTAKSGGLGVSPSDCVQPVRKYHYISKENIIHNGITLNGQIYNTVKVHEETYCANGFIPPQHRRLLNCDPLIISSEKNTDAPTIRAGYAQSFLTEELEKMYGGELLLRGIPSIEPHDVLIISDPALCMQGPVVVDKVIHSFNSDEGYITIVTPSLLVNTNEICQASIIDTAIYAAGKVLNTIRANYGVKGVVGAAVGGAAVGAGTTAGIAGVTVAGSTLVGTGASIAGGAAVSAGASAAAAGVGTGVIGTAAAEVAVVGAAAAETTATLAMAASGIIGGTFLWPVAVVGTVALGSFGLSYLLSEVHNAFPMFITPLMRYGKVWVAGVEGFRIGKMTEMYMDRWRNFLASDFCPLLESYRAVEGAMQVGIGASLSNLGVPTTSNNPTTGNLSSFLEAIGTQEGVLKNGTRPNRNNSPGDLEFHDWEKAFGAVLETPLPGHKARYAVFPTLAAGYAALGHLFTFSKYAGLTVSEAIKKFAPTPETTPTDQAIYIANICKFTPCNPNTLISNLL
jgi:hypothetical protein